MLEMEFVVCAKDKLDDVFADGSAIILIHVPHDVTVWCTHKEETSSSMHVFKWACIVVPESEWVRNSNKESIVDSRMSNIMHCGSQDESKELICSGPFCETSTFFQRKPMRGLNDICYVHCSVISVLWVVRSFNRLKVPCKLCSIDPQFIHQAMAFQRC